MEPLYFVLGGEVTLSSILMLWERGPKEHPLLGGCAFFGGSLSEVQLYFLMLCAGCHPGSLSHKISLNPEIENLCGFAPFVNSKG